MTSELLRTLAPVAELDHLAAEDPSEAARRALAAQEAIEAERMRKAVALLRAAPPEHLMLAVQSKNLRALTMRTTVRPVPPAYRVERVCIRDIVKSADDVIAFVEAHGGFFLVWGECVSLSGPPTADVMARRYDALKLGPEIEAIAENVRRVLATHKSALSIDEMLRATDLGVMLTEETVLGLASREDLRSPATCLDFLERLVDARGNDGTFEPPDHHLGRFLIRQLAATKHAPAAQLLAALAAVPTPYSRTKGDAVEALVAIGGRETALAIMGALERAIDQAIVPWDQHHLTLFASPMVSALLAVDDVDPFERLTPFFSVERLALPAGARIAKDVLYCITGKLSQTAHAVVKLLHPDAAPAVRLMDDPRWVDRIVRLLGDARMRIHAKHVLKSFPPMAVQESYVRVAGPKTKAPAPPSLDAAKVAASAAEADAIMTKLRATLEAAAAQLKKAKFSPKAKGKALAPVDAAIALGKIAEIEKLTKTRLPEALRSLYLIVGPIDFRPTLGATPPAGFEAFAAAPPLLVQPLDRALRDLKRRVRDNTGIPAPLRDPLALDLAPEIAARIDAWAFDPPLEGAAVTLLEHLRAVVLAWKLPGLPAF